MPPPERRALITGATGFVGSRLAARLAREGWQVDAIRRPRSNPGQLAVLAPSARLHEHDGSSEGLARIVAQAAPDTVFHLAAMFRSEHATADVQPMLEANVLFGAQLLEAMSLAGVKKLVNTGTSWQHYEDQEYNPVCLYAATKQAFEGLMRFYTEARGLRAITLDLFDTYGPGDPRRKLFKLLDAAAASGETLGMTSGRQLIDLVHVDDVAAAFVRASALLDEGAPAKPARYAVSSSAPISLRALVELYGSLGKPVKVAWGARAHRDREVMRTWSQGIPLPGWAPRIRLEDGLRELVAEPARTGVGR